MPQTIKFTEHRKTLKESNATTKEFENSQLMVDYLKTKFKVNKVISKRITGPGIRKDCFDPHSIFADNVFGALGVTDKPIIQEIKS